MSEVRLNLKSHRTYLQSIRAGILAKLRAFYGNRLPQITMKDLQRDQAALLKYPGLDRVVRNPLNLVKSQQLPVTPLEEFTAGKSMVLQGKFLSEHTVGGVASRLNNGAKRVSFGQKFFIPPKKLAYEIEASGFDGLLDLTLGERHMFQLSFAIVMLAREMGGEHWTNVLGRQKMLIVPNKEGEEATINTFRQFNFFGFSPENVMFSTSLFYPALVLENGILRFDEGFKALHNHGIVPMQVGMDDAIFTVNPDTGEKKAVPRWKFRESLAGTWDKVSYNVEDLNYFENPIDFRGIAIAMQFGLSGYRMVMEIARQKEDPQKGGMLAFDPEKYDGATSKRGRCTVIESFQLGLPPEKQSDGSANPDYIRELANIRWLNRNQNHFPFPLDSFDAVASGGLPIHPEVKTSPDGTMGIFNATCQGDINQLGGVPTAFLISDVPLKSLKTVKEIALTLGILRRQDKQLGFKQYLSQFPSKDGREVVFPDDPFAVINKLTPITPLTLEAILAQPHFIRRINKRFLNTLQALAEVFEVEGSLIYSARKEGEGVKLQIIPDSRRGTGKNYVSRASENEINAQDVKGRVVSDNRVWTGYKVEAGQSYILIANIKEGESVGELILLLGRYKEDVPPERKYFHLKGKLVRVLEHAIDRDMNIQAMREGFGKLSWQFLYENSVTQIEMELEKGTGQLKSD